MMARGSSGCMEVEMKKTHRYLSVCTALFFALSLLAVFLPQDASASESRVRLAGQSRYQTSKAIAESFNSGQVDDIVIASGNGFADALAVSVLAGELDAPILLVDRSASRSPDALDYISKHMPKGKIWIAGGKLAIDGSFETKLSSMGHAVERIAGHDRYETCLAIAEEESTSAQTPVFIASGENFPDALSIASAAASKGNPIILSPKNSLPGGVKNYLAKQRPSQVFIVGGPLVISQTVESEIKAVLPATAVTRIAGQDRFETSSKAYKMFFPNPPHVYIATGMDFADTLSASVLAAKDKAPIVLIDPAEFYPRGSTYSYLIDIDNPQMTVIGGARAVSELLADNIEYLLAASHHDPDPYPIKLENYTLSSATTSNSTVFFSGTVSPGVTEVYVIAENAGGGTSHNYYIPQNGSVAGILYFKNGAGAYKIDIYENVQESGSNNTYRTYSWVDGGDGCIVENTDTRADLQFLFPSRDVQSDHPEIMNLAESITKDLTSDYKKIKAVHDWVAKNIAYDVEGYNSGEYVCDALGVLHARKSVCQGYADLSAALLRAADVKTKVIHGIATWEPMPEDIKKNPQNYSSNHAWNEAYADGRWVVFDATWDAGGVTVYGEFVFNYTTEYFDPEPEVFAIDHLKTGVDEYR